MVKLIKKAVKDFFQPMTRYSPIEAATQLVYVAAGTLALRDGDTFYAIFFCVILLLQEMFITLRHQRKRNDG